MSAATTHGRKMTPGAARDARIIRIHLDWLRRWGKTETTIYQRKENLRRLTQALPCDLLDATEDDIENWQSALRVSLQSLATYSSHVRSFYAWAEEAGHMELSPARKLPIPRVPKRHARPMPEKDYELAMGCATEPMRTWLVLAGFMGLRSNEIATIQREDISEIAGRLVLSGMGKGQKPFKLVVPKEVVPYLEQHLTGRQGPLWRTPDGKPMTGRYLTKRASIYLHGLGLPYTLHSLRHRFGSQFYSSTTDLVLTQEVMRHESPNTTRLYVASSREEAAQAMDSLSTGLIPPRIVRRRNSYPDAA